MSKFIATIYFNEDNYPNNYQLDIWRDTTAGTYFIMDPVLSCYNGMCACTEDSGCGKKTRGVGNIGMSTEIIPDGLTIGETCRWIHTGKVDKNYYWLQVGFTEIWDNEKAHYSANRAFQKLFLDWQWDELNEINFHRLEFEIAFPIVKAE